MPTPEEEAAAAAAKAADEKAAADKAAADEAARVAAEAAKQKAVPEKYDLKRSEGSFLDDAAVEETAAIARELGLSQEAASKVFGHLDTRVGASVTAKLAELQPGGAVWTQQVQGWEKEVLADPNIGGSPEKVKESVTAAKAVLDAYFEPDVREFLNTSGLGSHPGVIRGFVKMAKAMGEGKFMKTGDAPVQAKASLEEKFYGKKESSTKE